MMLPLAIGISSQLPETENRTRTFIMLGVAYSASIGGIGTLVGSPPNVIAAAQAHITFMQWMIFGIPVTLILLPCAWLALHLVLRPDLNHRCAIQSQKFTWTHSRLLTLAILSCVS